MNETAEHAIRIRGDWMVEGLIDNYRRQPYIDIVVRNGVLYHVDHGRTLAKAELVDGTLCVETGIAFVPCAGELQFAGFSDEGAPHHFPA